MRLLRYCLIFLMAICGVSNAYAITDTLYEDFDNYVTNASIDGVDKWTCTQGDPDDAITQAVTTMTGGGNALELFGEETSVNVSRPDSYGSVSPCWVEFYIMPGLGAQRLSVPTGKIAAVSFDFTGKVYASDGEDWLDTGATFETDTWYRILLKIDFPSKSYNLYLSLASATMVEDLTALKSNLSFIDPSITSLSDIGFEGTYNSTREDGDNSFIDNFVVYFIERLEIITAAQTLFENNVSGPITVQLQDSYSAPQTAWEDITLEVRTSSGTGEFSMDKDAWIPINQVILSDQSQAVTFYYKDSTVGKPMIDIKEYPARGWDDALQEFNIVEVAAYFEVSVESPQIAGAVFPIVITARAEDGTMDTLYDGELELMVNYVDPETGTQTSEPHTLSGFEAGILSTNLKYSDCGTIEILFEDSLDSSKTGSSGQILFIPDSFSFDVDTPQVVNQNFEITVSALDADNKVTSNYKGPAKIKVIGVSPEDTDGEVSETDLESAEFSSGIVEKEISYNRWGSIELQVYDESYPEQIGTTEQIDFQPDSFVIEVSSPPGERDFFYVGEKIDITMSMFDVGGNPITNYVGLIKISSSLGLGLPSEYQLIGSDNGSHTFSVSLSHSGTYRVSASNDIAQLSAESSAITVKEATIEVISTVAPVGSTDVVIQLVDDSGQVITTESDLTITVAIDEEHDNTSATSSATTAPVTFRKGVAKIIISDTQAEVITITPMTSLDFKIKKGTVTFGRTAKSGIGTIMWREIKD